MALFLIAVATTALGCGATSSSAPHPSTPPTAGPRPPTALAWLQVDARPWNRALNADQQAIVAAGAAVDESSGSGYFSRLGTACSAMLRDTERALRAPHAPAAGLDAAWGAMLVETETYASDCMTLVRTRADRDFSTWNDSLTAMNQANSAWNQAVAAVRGGGSGSSG